jgi:hypothetical protein
MPKCHPWSASSTPSTHRPLEPARCLVGADLPVRPQPPAGTAVKPLPTAVAAVCFSPRHGPISGHLTRPATGPNIAADEVRDERGESDGHPCAPHVELRQRCGAPRLWHSRLLQPLPGKRREFVTTRASPCPSATRPATERHCVGRAASLTPANRPRLPTAQHTP